jgi:hypothetical protein
MRGHDRFNDRFESALRPADDQVIAASADQG